MSNPNTLREQDSLINQNKNAKARELQGRKDRLERKLKTMKEDIRGGRRTLRDVLEYKRNTLIQKCQELAGYCKEQRVKADKDNK